MNIYTILVVLLFISCSAQKKIVSASMQMKTFVKEISKSAKQQSPNFGIFPQNGLELLYHKIDKSKGIDSSYINAIDGVGVEALFYNKTKVKNGYRQNLLKNISGQSKLILVSDYVFPSDKGEALKANVENQYIPFVRDTTNYYYTQIPEIISSENSRDITSFQQVKNYLYHINPRHFATKQDYLEALADTNYDLLLIDLFFQDIALSKKDIAYLKLKKNGAIRKVIAYMNIGSIESYRYYWNSKWNYKKTSWIKKKYEGYEDERWVNYWDENWKNIIFKSKNSYLSKILAAEFDGVYLDNVEAYYFLYKK
ncbi:endo alpha-1,4 polygalactosaminidase [Wenyingzhuangia sp. IMCC45533]